MSWIIYALLSAIFAAFVAVFAKVGIQQVDSTLATTVRSILMAVVLSLAALATGKFKLLGDIAMRPMAFIVFSAIAGALSWLFYFLALKSGPASAVAALDRLSVVFVLLLAVLFLGEHLAWRSALGAVLITAGAVLMVLR